MPGNWWLQFQGCNLTACIYVSSWFWCSHWLFQSHLVISSLSSVNSFPSVKSLCNSFTKVMIVGWKLKKTLRSTLPCVWWCTSFLQGKIKVGYNCVTFAFNFLLETCALFCSYTVRVRGNSPRLESLKAWSRPCWHRVALIHGLARAENKDSQAVVKLQRGLTRWDQVGYVKVKWLKSIWTPFCESPFIYHVTEIAEAQTPIRRQIPGIASPTTQTKF